MGVGGGAVAPDADRAPVGAAGILPTDNEDASGPGISPEVAAAALDEQATYVAALQAYLARHKRYPSRARARSEEGVVMLYFAIDRQGTLIATEITESSGNARPDQAALDMVNRAAPFSPMPADMLQARLEVVVPVKFFLN